MMINMYILFFLMSIFLYTFNYKHILLTLISLEFMMIVTFMSLYLIMNLLNMNNLFILMYLTISICEGVLGLSLLVYLIRHTGNDYMNSINMLKW